MLIFCSETNGRKSFNYYAESGGQVNHLFILLYRKLQKQLVLKDFDSKFSRFGVIIKYF